MKETEKLKLKLPENSDWADIVALNDNFQALDRWLEQLRSDIIAKLNDTPAKEHTHTKKDITDFPTSLHASDVYPWAKQPNKPAYTANEVGAAASSHSHPVGNITGVLPVSKGGTGQTSLAALMSAMGAGKIAAGSYTGTGTYGESNPKTLKFNFLPKAIFIMSDGTDNNTVKNATLLIIPQINRGRLSGDHVGGGYWGGAFESIKVNGNSVLWWGNWAEHQLNANGTKYAYIALG